MADESGCWQRSEKDTAPIESGTDYESLKKWVFSIFGESLESFLIFARYEILWSGYLAILKEHRDRSDRACRLKFKNTGGDKNIVFDIPDRFKR